MTDKPRPKKHLGKAEGAWRAKRQANHSGRKLSRDFILSHFMLQPRPDFPEYEDLKVLILADGAVPACSQGVQFSHALGTEINSRKQQQPREKRVEATPEWYTEEAITPPFDPVAILFKDAAEAEFPVPTPLNALTEDELIKKQRQENIPKRKEPVKFIVETISGVKNFPQTPLLESIFSSVTTKQAPPEIVDDFEELYSNIDKQFEAKFKAQTEDDESMPTWDEPADKVELPKMPDREELLKGKTDYPAYNPQKLPMRVMQEQLAIGNPFAPIVMDKCIPDANEMIWPPARSKAHGKTWYYKDPNHMTQGPFDSIEMYNWYVAGFFKPDLLLSTELRGPYIPLGSYRDIRYSYYNTQYPVNDEIEPPKTVAEIERRQGPWSVPFSSKAPTAKPKQAQVCENATNDLKNILGIMSSR